MSDQLKCGDKVSHTKFVFSYATPYFKTTSGVIIATTKDSCCVEVIKYEPGIWFKRDELTKIK